MAKALKETKTPKVKKVVEPDVVEDIVDIPHVPDVPPSVTLDEVTSVVEEEIIETVEQPIIPQEEAPKMPVILPIPNDTPKGEQVVKFLSERGDGDIRLNEIIKSLYPSKHPLEPPQWLNQGVIKQIKTMLSKLVNDGKITIANNLHLRLGERYYDSESKQQHHNIDSIVLLGKIKK